MKNRPPNVFLSSTMYDLSELRMQLEGSHYSWLDPKSNASVASLHHTTQW